MKKFILITGFLLLASALGLRGYFALVPPPDPSLQAHLTEIFPEQLKAGRSETWTWPNRRVHARISNFLNFDDALFRL